MQSIKKMNKNKIMILIAIYLFSFPLSSFAASKNKKNSKGAKTSKVSKHKSKKSKIKTKTHSDDYLEGVASCYASKFVGRKTTSGDIFKMDRYTGAHPTLPMRTKLKVTNDKTGDVVYIEVNDRMGKVSGHVIDLTKAAGNKIGICPLGIASVTLDILDNDVYYSMLSGQIGRSIISANPLLSTDDALELANQLASMKRNNESGIVIESSNREL
ncbi:MAG: septal ring lytic transglycosylase RlpA family protein [Burkholderiales bacterium]|nr:septal ring lytic transglycosylase RlpA family protein [Burkholderiales bacterium]